MVLTRSSYLVVPLMGLPGRWLAQQGHLIMCMASPFLCVTNGPSDVKDLTPGPSLSSEGFVFLSSCLHTHDQHVVQ